MRQGVEAVGGIHKEHPGFAIVVRLTDYEVEQVTRLDGFVRYDGNAGLLGFLQRAPKLR